MAGPETLEVIENRIYSEIALGDQLTDRQAVPSILQGDGHHVLEVGADQSVRCGLVAVVSPAPCQLSLGFPIEIRSGTGIGHVPGNCGIYFACHFSNLT